MLHRALTSDPPSPVTRAARGRSVLRLLAAAVPTLVVAAVLMGAGVALGAPDAGHDPRVSTATGLGLKLTSSMRGVTASGNRLECPPVRIDRSSGEKSAACEFTISATKAAAIDSVTVTMSARGIDSATAAAKKFAMITDPSRRSLVHLQTTEQTIYTFIGADLPVTVRPGVAWGMNAGTDLDNGDLGRSIVVTYTVVAESVHGSTASAVPSPSPVAAGSEEVAGVTNAPTSQGTPPPTATTSTAGPSRDDWLLVVAMLTCVLLGAAVGATLRPRRPRCHG